MVGCALGVVLFSDLINENTKRTLQRVLYVLAPLSLSGLIALSFLADGRDPRMYYFGFVLVELLAAALIVDVFVSHRSVIRQLLAMKWLVWIGSISYGLYLWHYVVFLALYGLDFDRLAVFTIGTLLTFGIASLSYYAMEKPILRLKQR